MYMAKNENTALLLIGAVVAFFLLRKRKQSTTAPTATGLRNEIAAAKQAANQLANDVINTTTFEPDATTFADMYARDQKNCR